MGSHISGMLREGGGEGGILVNRGLKLGRFALEKVFSVLPKVVLNWSKNKQ